MARVSEPLDDTTSLDGSRIDVGARIGWLLRVNRGAAGLSLRQMAAAMADHGATMSAATLSRVESEGLRSVVALQGYARVLGLPTNSLQVSVDYLCHSFVYGPPTSLPAPEPRLESFTQVCEAVERGATGEDWLEFSRWHCDDTPFGLPAHLMRPHVRRLVLELCRGVRLARWARYDALLRLRCSRGYDDLVAEAVAEVLADPALLVGEDLVAVVAEHPTPEVVRWTGDLLSHPSAHLARSASFAIQSMLVNGGPPELCDWDSLPAAFDRAWDAAGADPARLEALSSLHAALPPPLRQRLTHDPRPRADTTGPTVWTRNRRNAHYGFAASVAHAVTSGRGLPDDPMLARLLFESMYDPRGVRMALSTVLLASTPYAPDLVSQLLARRGQGPDDRTRAAAARVAAFCHGVDELPDVDSLLSAEDPEEFQHALRIFGDAGQVLPASAVARGLAGDENLVRHTLIAMGRAGDPRLTEIASDDARPETVRGAADWWLRHGPRIVD